MVVPYCNADRANCGSAKSALKAVRIVSTGNDCWSTNPAANEINSGWARVLAIRTDAIGSRRPNMPGD